MYPGKVASATVSLKAPPEELFDSTERRCRVCRSSALITDWAQGDRVCTSCGVVDEEHLLDSRPEWREFEDKVTSTIRCGMVPVDETKYLGGLQPTHWKFGNSLIRSKLSMADRRMDVRVRKQHKRDLMNARLAIQIQRRNGDSTTDTDFGEGTDIRPEMEQMILKEERDTEHLQAALYADKWSLDRAIQLGSRVNKIMLGPDDQLSDDRDADLEEKLDGTLKKASLELFGTYSMLSEATKRLDLPPRVVQEMTSLLCRYAVKQDGLLVRGISQRRSREEVKTTQKGALCAGIILAATRTMKYPRSIQEICEAIQAKDAIGFPEIKPELVPFIMKKHCSRALNELKTAFPELRRTTIAVVDVPTASSNEGEPAASTTTDETIIKYTTHALKKLRLPPVAQACVQSLVWKVWNTGRNDASNPKKLSVICAASTLLVTKVGSVMQNLANQSRTNHPKKRRRFSLEDIECEKTFHQEKNEYETLRVWDAWTEQRTWERKFEAVQAACGVPRGVLVRCYVDSVSAIKEDFLQHVQTVVTGDCKLDPVDTLLKNTPLATILLSTIASAGPLVKSLAQSSGV